MYAIVDIETTGLGARGNKITEISIFVYDGKKVIREFTSLVNPESPINYRISRLTGITNDMVRNAPKFFEIAKEVVQYTQDCIFVAHNVSFDYNVIKYELEELGAEFIRKKLCTVRLSRKLIPGQNSYSLGNLCTALGISVNGRHRARGDCEATMILFEKLMALDTYGVIDSFLAKKRKPATLPPLLSKETLDLLTNQTGVYYFKDKVGKVIYVGKANDIKQRVLSHIYDKSNKEQRLCRETADIGFTVTGNELTALLLESDEIKKLYPKYNRSQKRNTYGYGIATYKDRKGIRNIIYNRLGQLEKPLLKFYNLNECRNFLEHLCEKHELCPRYCGLQNISGACFHYHIKKCNGVCCNIEEIESYNKRVDEALKLRVDQRSYIIHEEGRNTKEKALILVKSGIYLGFVYLPKSDTAPSFNDCEKVLISRVDNRDVQRILRSYLNKKGDSKVVYYQELFEPKTL